MSLSLPSWQASKISLTAKIAAIYRGRRSACVVIAAFSLLVLAAERDVSTLPFLIATAGVFAGCAFAVSSRLRFALVVAMGALGLSAAASMIKYKFLAMNAHVIDVWFYVAGGETLIYLLDQFPWVVAATSIAIAMALAVLVAAYRLDDRRDRGRGSALGVAVLCAAALPLTLPREAGEFAYHIRKNHFVSSFFVSLSDIARLAGPGPLTKRLGDTRGALPFLRGAACEPIDAPDIVLVLSESAVPPAQVPGWRYDRRLMRRFESYDGRLHRARVETHGGGTWISEASVMSGLSMADFGWMRPYPTMLMRDHIHTGLPAALEACGYATAMISPAAYTFVNNGPLLTSLGFKDYIDRFRMKANSQQEPDAFYFRQALDYIARHRATDKRPLFLYVETTTAHAPYDFRFQPNLIAPGEPFGNDPQTDEYLRRLTFAQDDFANFGAALENMGERPVLLAQFGDHHPFISRDAFAAAGLLDATDDFNSPIYETFYAVKPIAFEPALKLPDVPALDLAYLGVTLMEMAGLPLDATLRERRSLRDACDGRFHTCRQRTAVDTYLARLVASGLLTGF